MNETNSKVDAYLERAKTWREESEKLRAIALDKPLVEELKWGKPCYSFQGTNLLIIQGFKDSCSLLFCKGSVLKDPRGILQKPGENSHIARRILFTSLSEIEKLEPTLKAYIDEAIEAEKAGLEVTTVKKPEPVPDELQGRLDELPAFKTAFASLTPGRQRAYILHFSAAKQSATRASRVEKCIPQILAGKGLTDR